MKIKNFLFLSLLIFILLTLCSCDGRVAQKTISAQDSFTGRILSLNISARYSPGDFDASGGCSFSSELDFSEMVEIAIADTEVSYVEVFESYEQHNPYQHMGVFVEEENGLFSVFYLENDCFYGMKTRFLKTKDELEGIEMLFPYHLVSDTRLSPVEGTMLEGVEYTCVDTEDICSEFQQFYQITGHYEVRSGESKVFLLTDYGQIEFSFIEHAGLTFVSAMFV